MSNFVAEVHVLAGPSLCKIGKFIADQDREALLKEGVEPLTEAALVEANAIYPADSVRSALMKRGLKVGDTAYRKHMLHQCMCETREDKA